MTVRILQGHVLEVLAGMARARIRADLGRVKSNQPEQEAADLPLFGGPA